MTIQDEQQHQDTVQAAPEETTAVAEIRAQAEADAIRIKAEAEAERLRLSNARAAMKLEADRALHAKKLAELETARRKVELEAERLTVEEQSTAAAEAERAAEALRTERMWKWGARGIYVVGLAIAAPVQFIAFWDRARPFLIAAPVLLEGLALVLAFGAAWAVAHRRDVLPYRIGIMLGALVAAVINMWHGLFDPAIGLNAGLIGGIASIGGPVVLMAYEHGEAQKRDGIPSRRERRAEAKALRLKAAEEEERQAEKKAADEARRQDKEDATRKLAEEQQRKDRDRQNQHAAVWNVAEGLRSARGAECVTEQIWADAWYRVTGSKTVGVTAEVEARSRAAQARMKAAVEGLLEDPESLGGKGLDDIERPLEEADLDMVRTLAMELGDAELLSSKKVRERVGCRTEYAVRLRDTVKDELAS